MFVGVYRSISYEKTIKNSLIEEKEGINILLGRKKYKMPEMSAVEKITLEIIGIECFENASFALLI